MAAALGDYFAGDGHSQQREIAYDVEYLVTDKLVVKPQRGLVEHTVRRQNDGVVERAAQGEICPSQHVDLVCKAKGAGRRYLFAERAVLKYKPKRLPPDKRVREI